VGGPSGGEEPAAAVLRRAWADLSDVVRGDALGNVWALRRGSAPQPRPVLVLAAHLDTVGLLITSRLPGGFVRLAPLGALDARSLLGREVVIAGREAVPALVATLPPHLTVPAARRRLPPLPELLLDTGLPDADLARLVRPGDRAHFAAGPLRLLGDWVAAPGLDNRAGVAALHEVLCTLGPAVLAADLYVLANVQEEVGLRGIGAAGRQLRPTAAVVVDVGFGAQPGADERRTLAPGRGPALGVGPGLHPAVGELLEVEAARLEVPLQREILAGPSGTDAWALQVAAGGVPVALLSIPLRSMHSPAESLDYGDVRCAGELLAGFAAAVTPEWAAGLRQQLAGAGPGA